MFGPDGRCRRVVRLGADHRSGHSLVQRLKENFFNQCDGFVVPGRSSLEYVLSMGARPEQVFKAPNAVDIQLFSMRSAVACQNAFRLRGVLGLPSRYFLFVGRLVNLKGVAVALRAFALVEKQRPAARLRIVGDGPLLGESRRLAGELGIAHAVRFLPFQTPARLV